MKNANKIKRENENHTKFIAHLQHLEHYGLNAGIQAGCRYALNLHHVHRCRAARLICLRSRSIATTSIMLAKALPLGVGLRSFNPARLNPQRAGLTIWL